MNAITFKLCNTKYPDSTSHVAIVASTTVCGIAAVIYESSLRAGPGWRESLYRHQGCLKASDCGRLGRQAAWSPLERAPRGEKLPKDYPTASVLLEAKAAALHPEWYQSLLSKLSTKREGEAGKRSAGNRIG
jgi:hypothetical protein